MRNTYTDKNNPGKNCWKVVVHGITFFCFFCIYCICTWKSKKKTRACQAHYPLTPVANLLHWRASEASETPSIATYRKKCLGVSTSKPQCACSQFYVKRRSGRVCYKKPACCSRVQLRKARFTYIKTTKRMHIK